MKKLIILFTLFITTFTHAEDILKDYSIYFFGVVQHFDPVPDTQEGNMEYFSISKSNNYKNWEFETGLGTYIDSYGIRAYKLYTNISSENFRFWIFQPRLGIAIHSKGVEYNSNERKTVIISTPQLRVGDINGLFMNIMPIPKLSPYTNGFVAVEFGYKF